MKIYQFSCKEGRSVDMRQANAVLRHKPDVIVFEAPAGKTSSLPYNKYSPSNKPLNKLDEYEKMLKKVSEKYPWVASDIFVYKNIKKLWSEGHDIKLYHVDSPKDLLQTDTDVPVTLNPNKPCRRGAHLLWWVFIYLREKIMTKHLRKILTKHEGEKILIFLQSFHWRNVQFQLTNPSKKELWKYYFGAFKNLKPEDVTESVKKQNKIIYKYWNKLSDFK